MIKNKLFTLVGFLVLSFNTHANNIQIDSLINSKDFIFRAETVLSEQKLSQLYEQYDIAINKNTATAYLPYYGNRLTHKSDESGIIFSSENFQYDYNWSGGRCKVLITPHDISLKIGMVLIIEDNGEAVLSISDDRHGIVEYYGYVEAYQE